MFETLLTFQIQSIVYDRNQGVWFFLNVFGSNCSHDKWMFYILTEHVRWHLKLQEMFFVCTLLQTFTKSFVIEVKINKNKSYFGMMKLENQI